MVDDQASVRLVITRLLARIGTRRVETAANGAEALRCIEATDEPFDVVICDLSMPTEDGLVCLRNLGRLQQKPAVILMSGQDEMVLESAHKLGLSFGLTILGAISKPLTGGALAILLDALKQQDATVRVVPPPMLTKAEIELALEAGRFEVWFQPQCQISSRRAVGVEALLRLRYDDQSLAGPASFVTVAEQNGLIGRLTDVVLDRATHWCGVWRAAGCYLTMSINLSHAGLDDLTLPDRAAAFCASRGLDARQLVFELTESSLAVDAVAMLDIVARLRLKGFRLSLDDFGTGFASLEALRSLPFHELKLDRQFVQSASESPRSRAILETSIGLASLLRMSTVAEGVETDEMLKTVAELGCHVAQGYLFARPMPAEEVLGWLTNWAADLDAAPEQKGPAHRSASTPAQSALAIAASASEFGDTVRGFVHDCASPLMLVLTLSEMLLEDSNLIAKYRDDVGLIHEAAQEVSVMVQTLRQQARGAGTPVLMGSPS